MTLIAPPTCSLPENCPYACADRAGSWSVSPVASRMGLSVRAIFFDLDNTLIDTAGASRKGMLEVTSGYPRPSSGRSHRTPPGTTRLPVLLLSCLLFTYPAPGSGDPSRAQALALRPSYWKERDRRTKWAGEAAFPAARRLGSPACLCVGSGRLGS